MSVWGRSSEFGYQRFIIFSVDGGAVGAASFWAWALSRGLKAKRLQGCYKGQQEASFLLPAADVARIIPWIVNQESVLVLSEPDARERRAAALWFHREGRHETLGVFRQVSKAEAFKQDGWTYDFVTGAYFACRPILKSDIWWKEAA